MQWRELVTITNPNPAPSDPSAWRISGLLAVITVLVYLPAGFHGFTFFDDPDYVSENAVVQKGLTWGGLKWAFIGWHASNWHPLTWLSHEVDCQLFGLNPGAHHLVNVLFHATNTVLLFQLWLRLTRARWPSALVAALFAWHPLHVESVAWVAERKDVLSTFFGLLTMLAYARFAEESKVGNPESKVQSPRSKVWYIVSLGLFALALLAKPMMVTLPFVLLLLDYWPLGRFTEDRRPLHTGLRLALEKWPFFLLTTLSCLCTFLAQRHTAVISLEHLSPGVRLENAVVAAAAYLGKTLWPVNLCIFYPMPKHFALGEVVFSALVLAGVSGVVWHWRRRHGYFLAGWLWFLGMLVPVIGLVQVGEQAMADRYTYLPAVGLFVAAAFGLAEAQARFKLPGAALGLGGVVMLGACVTVTEHQLAFWRDSETLFKRAVAVTKNNGKAHMILSIIYNQQGRTAESRQEFQEARDYYAAIMVPAEGGREQPLAAFMNLQFGQKSELAGDKKAALAYYREALRLDPNFAVAHNELGYLLEEAGTHDEALVEYQAVARLRPENPEAHENLGTQLAKMGRFAEALGEYQTATRLSPADPQLIYLTGRALLHCGQTGAAIAAFQNALRLNPNDCPSLVYLARVLAADESPQIRNATVAVTLAEQANRLTGGTQSFVLGTLAMAYAEAGRFEEARKSVQAAIQQNTGGGPEAVSELEAQLKTYEAGQPWRESFAGPVPGAGKASQ